MRLLHLCALPSGVFALALAALLSSRATAGPHSGAVSYARQIRPILQAKCQGCHQPASAGGKLMLSSYADLMKGGEHGATVVANKPETGTLLGYLTGKPELMPQGGSALLTAQIDLFRRWIAQGAHDDTRATVDAIDAQHPPVYTMPPVITALAYSPDGKTLAVSGYREILLHHSDGSGLIARLVGRSQKILSLVYSPDGKTLAAVGGSPAEFGEAQFWDPTADKLVNSVTTGYDTLFGGSYSPDGKELGFGCADNSVRVISAPDGKQVMRLDNHSDWVFATTFSADGKDILSVSRDQAIKLTQVDTGSFIDDINTHYSALRCLVRRPGMDQVMCAGDDGIPRLYKIFRTEARTMNQEDHNLIRAYDTQEAVATCLAFSADGKKFAVGTETGRLAIYSVEDGKLLYLLPGAKGGLYALTFRPDGAQLAAGGFDGTVRLYDLSTGRLTKAFTPVPIEQRKEKIALSGEPTANQRRNKFLR